MWDPSPDAEVTGYKVYMRTPSTSYSEANSFLTTQLSYRDLQVSDGAAYFYAVTAVGGLGQEVFSVETGETYFNIQAKTYTDKNKSKPAPFSIAPTVAVVGDLNKDGKQDLILGIPGTNTVKIYLVSIRKR
jgi:hypothetical protein